MEENTQKRLSENIYSNQGNLNLLSKSSMGKKKECFANSKGSENLFTMNDWHLRMRQGPSTDGISGMQLMTVEINNRATFEGQSNTFVFSFRWVIFGNLTQTLGSTLQLWTDEPPRRLIKKKKKCRIQHLPVNQERESGGDERMLSTK